jgi:hypothetical protein
MAIIGAVAVWFVPVSAQSKPGNRSIIYLFQRYYSFVVFVSMTETDSKPKGEVGANGIRTSSQNRVLFDITPNQFEKIWSSFRSSGIDQYPFEQARHTVDFDYYYVFVVAGQRYAVPKKKASPTAAMLANRMEAYAAETVARLKKPSKGPTDPPERVIIH